MQRSAQVKCAIATGLAFFAMFFGAGNIIFPLKVGAFAGQHVTEALIAFIISGVGVPFLGLFAVSLYGGNYWKFFNRLGRPLAFIVVTFLIMIVGPLCAAPRTEVISFNTLLPVLPEFLKNPYVFTSVYFSVVFLLLCKQTRVVDIIGLFFSPIKIVSFLILIVIGLYTATPAIQTSISGFDAMKSSLTMGYGTMDLLAAFFFCSVAYRNVVSKCESAGSTSPKVVVRIMLFACLIGALLISLVYAGFIYAASAHATLLRDVPTEALIGQIAAITLGQYGTLFMGVCVLIACLATGTTLAEVTTDYFYRSVFQKRVPRMICLVAVMFMMAFMSILGFSGIMKMAGPVLNVIYPLMIALCVVNIVIKLRSDRQVFTPRVVGGRDLPNVVKAE